MKTKIFDFIALLSIYLIGQILFWGNHYFSLIWFITFTSVYAYVSTKNLSKTTLEKRLLWQSTPFLVFLLISGALLGNFSVTISYALLTFVTLSGIYFIQTGIKLGYFIAFSVPFIAVLSFSHLGDTSVISALNETKLYLEFFLKHL